MIFIGKLQLTVSLPLVNEHLNSIIICIVSASWKAQEKFKTKLKELE